MAFDMAYMTVMLMALVLSILFVRKRILFGISAMLCGAWWHDPAIILCGVLWCLIVRIGGGGGGRARHA